MGAILKAMVYGPAGSQGSKCSFPHPVTGNMIMIESSKNSRTWRQEMVASMELDQPEFPIGDAVFAWMRVYVSRPKSHFIGNDLRKGLKKNAPIFPKSGKDMDKIKRAVGDAAKIAKWVVDDARIAGWNSLRLYTEDLMTPERVEVMMYNLEEHGLNFIDKVLERISDGHPIHNDLVPPFQETA